MPSECSDVRPEDALQVAQRALAKANRIDDLEASIEKLKDDLTAAQLRLSEIDEDKSYDDLTRDDKIGMVREHAFRRAMDNGGRAALDYKAIRWEVFDGNPSPRHCYDLMKWASEHPGFEHQKPDGGNERLAVDVDAAKRGAAFYPGNKDGLTEGV